MEISLNPELERFLDSKLRNAQYKSIDEAINALLKLSIEWELNYQGPNPESPVKNLWFLTGECQTYTQDLSITIVTPEQIQEVTRLRGLNLSPKQIARKLGVRPAAVTALLRQQAEDLAIARREAGELAPLVSCLINSEAAERLLNSNSQDLEFDNQLSGLAQVAVTRLDRSQYVLTTYLVDYFCLGVKDVIGPRKLNSTKHSVFIDKMYASFEGKKEITLLEAQAIIFGAVEYAKKLGLNPHSDWLKGKEHLGHPSENLPSIEFGRSGKPFFICGPYDNPDRIIAKLKETVGEGNFDYIVPSGKDLFSW